MTKAMIRAIILAAMLPASVAAAEPCRIGLPRYEPRPIRFTSGKLYVTTDGNIRIVGYNDMAEMLQSLSQIFTDSHPDFRFELVLKGTRTAPSALTNGTSLFAPMGAEMEDAPLAEFKAARGTSPLLFRVAHASLDPAARSSPVGVYVHPENPLKTIGLDQLRRIFAPVPGEKTIRRWGDLGIKGKWANRLIKAKGLADQTAIGQFLRRHKFKGAAFVPGYEGRLQSHEVVESVAAEPLSLGLANLNHANSKVRLLGLAIHKDAPAQWGSADDIRSGNYPFDRYLLVYVTPEADGGIDPIAREWMSLILSCEGQQVIAKGRLGYLPLNPAEALYERRKINQNKQSKASVK